jgi:hypothetical protein
MYVFVSLLIQLSVILFGGLIEFSLILLKTVAGLMNFTVQNFCYMTVAKSNLFYFII